MLEVKTCHFNAFVKKKREKKDAIKLSLFCVPDPPDVICPAVQSSTKALHQ